MDHKNKPQEEHSDFLSELKNKEGFQVPKDYFATMQQNVLDEVLELSTKTNTQSSLFDQFIFTIQSLFKPQYALVTAAAVILIGLSIGIGSNNTENASAFDELSEADLEYYIDLNIDEMNSQEFYTALASTNIEIHAPISTVNVPQEVANEFIEEMDESTFIEFQPED